MSRAQELLDAATPLPWTQDQFDLYLTGPDGDPIHWDMEGLGATWAKDDDPKLILYAVNALPAYEAAREALERLMAEYTWTVSQPWEDARTALARLRDEVPA